MITFLLFLSLVLNLVALFAIIILFLRQNRLSEVEKKQEKMNREMEEVISSYLIQMKEENDQFLKRMSEVDLKEKPSREKLNIEQGKVYDDPIKDINVRERTGKVPVNKAVSAYQKYTHTKKADITIDDEIELPPLDITQEEKDTNDLKSKEEIKNKNQVQSLLSQVLNLKDKGFSEEEIAKKLNRGKTEIALLLKFNQNF